MGLGNVVATGNGPHGFTVTVNLGGSTDIITRDLTMLIDIRGDVSAAQDADGFDLLNATVGTQASCDHWSATKRPRLPE